MSGTLITVQRDADATLVPMGTPIVIPAGSQVRITQELGGSYTVAVGGNLARIEGKDADALGLDGQAVEQPAAQDAGDGVSGPVNQDQVWEVLKTCYDPEIPVNIVDLGLIYDMHVVEDEHGGQKVEIVMTLTAPGCGMGPYIVEDVRQKVLSVPNVSDVHVELVFDPPWDRSRMSEEAKLQLGMF